MKLQSLRVRTASGELLQFSAGWGDRAKGQDEVSPTSFSLWVCKPEKGKTVHTPGRPATDGEIEDVIKLVTDVLRKGLEGARHAPVAE
jgi:hypothetical protein